MRSGGKAESRFADSREPHSVDRPLTTSSAFLGLPRPRRTHTHPTRCEDASIHLQSLPGESTAIFKMAAGSSGLRPHRRLRQLDEVSNLSTERGGADAPLPKHAVELVVGGAWERSNPPRARATLFLSPSPARGRAARIAGLRRQPARQEVWGICRRRLSSERSRGSASRAAQLTTGRGERGRREKEGVKGVRAGA